jgi:hypothetical protein
MWLGLVLATCGVPSTEKKRKTPHINWKKKVVFYKKYIFIKKYKSPLDRRGWEG